MNEPTPQIISRMIVLPARGQHIDGGRRGPFENWDSNSDAKQLRDRDFFVSHLDIGQHASSSNAGSTR